MTLGLQFAKTVLNASPGLRLTASGIGRPIVGALPGEGLISRCGTILVYGFAVFEYGSRLFGHSVACSLRKLQTQKNVSLAPFTHVDSKKTSVQVENVS